MKIRIYISGKVTGEAYLGCYKKFSDMEEKLKQCKYLVINPMRLCKPSWSWQRCMIKCVFYLIFKADVLLLLSDWENSRGARLEKRIAAWFKKTILEENEFFNG